MNHPEARIWAAIPAAGAGRRMGGTTPKQYLALAGQRVIEHSIAALLGHPRIAGVYVAVSPDDPSWGDTRFARHPAVWRVDGGSERALSVRNMLAELKYAQGDEQDWVLVHDAARPCLGRDELDALIAACECHPVGGLLGVPVRDTMKRADHQGLVADTLSREGLWHAFTPQMFRLGPLLKAIDEALAKGRQITDEASAMEAAGMSPLMVEGHPGNIKITRPGDLALAEFFLHAHHAHHAHGQQPQ